MEKASKSEALSEDVFDDLQTQLLSGDMSQKDFLDTIDDLDQSDPQRASSVRASEILSRPEIEGMFSDSEQRMSFYSIRSLSHFHKAQILLFKGNTDVLSVLQAARADSIAMNDPFMQDWISYIQATIAYLNNDVEEIRKLLPTIKDNHALVKNFIQGLEERGHPDYITDYSKERTP